MSDAGGAAAAAEDGSAADDKLPFPQFDGMHKLTPGNLRLGLVSKMCMWVFFKKEDIGDMVSSLHIANFIDVLVKHADPSFTGGGKSSVLPLCSRAEGSGGGKIAVGGPKAATILLAMTAIDATQDLSKIADTFLLSAGDADSVNFRIHHHKQKEKGGSTKAWVTNNLVLRSKKDATERANKLRFTLPDPDDTAKCKVWCDQKELTLAQVLTATAGKTGTTITKLWDELNGNGNVIAKKKPESRSSSPAHGSTTPKKRRESQESPLRIGGGMRQPANHLDLDALPDETNRHFLRALHAMMAAPAQLSVLPHVVAGTEKYTKAALMHGGLVFDSKAAADAYLRGVNLARQALGRDYNWAPKKASLKRSGRGGGGGGPARKKKKVPDTNG